MNSTRNKIIELRDELAQTQGALLQAMRQNDNLKRLLLSRRVVQLKDALAEQRTRVVFTRA